MKPFLLMVAAALCACSSSDDTLKTPSKNTAGSAGSGQAGASAGGSAGSGQGAQGGSEAGGSGAQAGNAGAGMSGGSGQGGAATGGSAGAAAGGSSGAGTGDGCVDLCSAILVCAPQAQTENCPTNCEHRKQMAGSDCYKAFSASAGCRAADPATSCNLINEACAEQDKNLLAVCGNGCGGGISKGTSDSCSNELACGPTTLKIECDGEACTCVRNGSQVGTCPPSSGTDKDPCDIDAGCCAQLFFE